MKRFLKLFLIFLYTVFSLGVNACDASVLKNDFSNLIQKTASENSALLNFDIADDTAFVSSNSNVCEIAALKSELDSGIGLYTNSVPQNIFNKNFIKQYYTNILSKKACSICPVLKNEICVRAP